MFRDIDIAFIIQPVEEHLHQSGVNVETLSIHPRKEREHWKLSQHQSSQNS